jgi:dihydroorotate dehydrogenase
MKPAPPVTSTFTFERIACRVLAAGYALMKPLLFAQDAESAHERVLGLVGAFPRLAMALAPSGSGAVPTTLAGLTLPSPVGLAAGLDKEGHALPLWEKLGFGFVEMGTVTPRPQPGNPRPRVHRIVQHKALVNSMGFPSEGADAVRTTLEGWKTKGLWPSVPVGVNLGKNKDTPAEDAAQDYAAVTEVLGPYADYLTVNVSSPNTPGLRALQHGEGLRRIVLDVLSHSGTKPVFVKLAPDMDEVDLKSAVETALQAGAAGIIATNTTRERRGIAEAEALTGGLSGAPLFPLARERIGWVLEASAGKPVVGVGGIRSPEQVQELMEMGCAAVQLYSGLIFEGPTLVHRINASLSAAVAKA